MLVCVCVWLSLATFPHYCTDPDVTWGMVRGAPSCALLDWFESVHWFRFYDSIARNPKCQRVLVLVLCLVIWVLLLAKKVVWTIWIQMACRSTNLIAVMPPSPICKEIPVSEHRLRCSNSWWHQNPTLLSNCAVTVMRCENLHSVKMWKAVFFVMVCACVAYQHFFHAVILRKAASLLVLEMCIVSEKVLVEKSTDESVYKVVRVEQ